MAISESGKTWTHFLDRWWRIDHAPHLSQIWAKFKRKKLNHFVKGPSETTRVEAMKHLFNNSQRNLLVHGILQRIIVRDRKGRCKDLDKLIDEGTYLNVYPIHDGSSHLTSSLNLRSKLGAMWNGTQQPIHDIQSYYGEKVAFYFAWLEHYTFWLFLIGGIGSVVMMYGIFVSFSSTSLVDLQYNTESILKLSQALDNQLTLPFAFCMSVWGLLYVQWWSRRNQFLVSQWNMMDFFKEEKTRPAWRATGVKLSLVSGKLESHFSWTRRNLLRGTSIALIACLLIIMIISVESYILYNAWISHFLRKHHPDLAYLASVTSATIALLASVVLSGISRYISQKLTDLENHRTMSEYESKSYCKSLYGC